MANVFSRIFSPHHPLMPRDGTSPRWLVLGWCLWLLCSWAVTLWIDSPEPAVRWMLFSSMTGMLVVWPLLRLSQAGAVRGGVHPVGVACDWLLLNLVFQAVVWPLMITAKWSVMQTVLLVGVAAAWSLAIGAVVAWGAMRSGAARRSLSMAGVLAILLAEPVLQGVTRGTGLRWAARVSPIEALWVLTSNRIGVSGDDLMRYAAQAVTIAVAGVLLWLLVAVVSRSGVPRPLPPEASQPAA